MEALVPAGVTLAEPTRGGGQALAPARTVSARVRGVEPETGDGHIGMARVRVDGDPLALATAFPAHVAVRSERARDELAAAQGVTHGA